MAAPRAGCAVGTSGAPAAVPHGGRRRGLL